MGLETATLMTIAAAAAGTTAVVGVYSAVEQHGAAKDAKKERNKQYTAQQNISRIRERNAKIKQLREERIKRAVNTQRASQAGGSAEGLSGASGYQGAQGSLSSELATNLGQMREVSDLNTIVGQASKNIFDINSDLQKKQAVAKGVGAISGTIFQGAGGFGAFKSDTSTGTTTGNVQSISDKYKFNFGLD